MTKKKKKGRGGKRPGAGRKRLPAAKRKKSASISFRVPVALKEAFYDNIPAKVKDNFIRWCHLQITYGRAEKEDRADATTRIF